ncbi:MAG: SDR family oxidoreductase [Chloroflexota bacterium]|nr:SDR family oxidoreductase [Chloroflexota bacterium]
MDIVEKRALAGKVALVTGGSRGVGAATARLLAEAGAAVAINYRDKRRRAEAVAAEVEAAGSSALIVQADITVESSIEAMVKAVGNRFDRLDLLILNASGGLEKDVAPDYAMLLNRDAQVRLVREALPIMRPGGRLVFVTSHLAHFHGEQPVLPEYEPVAASKKAGETALRAMIPDLTSAGVRLVIVSGDLIDGTITPKLLDRMRPGTIDERRRQVGWLPTTEDFARAIVDAARATEAVTGDTIYVGSID